MPLLEENTMKYTDEKETPENGLLCKGKKSQ